MAAPGTRPFAINLRRAKVHRSTNAGAVLTQFVREDLHYGGGAIQIVSWAVMNRASSIQGPIDHTEGKRRLRGEADLLGNPGQPAAGRIRDPRARHIQFPVDRRVPASAGIGEVDGDLAVLDAPGSAGVLALHADSGGALLQVTGLINHQYRTLIMQLLEGEATQIVPDRIGIPLRPRQQMLQAVRAVIAGVLGQRPAMRGRSDKSPSTNSRASRRGSTRVNRPAMRPIRASNMSCQQAGSTL